MITPDEVSSFSGDLNNEVQNLEVSSINIQQLGMESYVSLDWDPLAEQRNPWALELLEVASAYNIH